MPGESFDALLATLKRAAALLRDAGVPFLLGGGIAAWARGGPESNHDLDLMLRPEDAERALEVLQAGGFRGERPPEGWLLKAYDEGGVLVDLIFEPVGCPITDDVFERAEHLEVEATPLLVMALEDVLVTKLHALGEHELDYGPLLEIARALREQVDWSDVRGRTQDSPYAAAFFTLVEELGVVGTQRTGG